MFNYFLISLVCFYRVLIIVKEEFSFINNFRTTERNTQTQRKTERGGERFTIFSIAKISKIHEILIISSIYRLIERK